MCEPEYDDTTPTTADRLSELPEALLLHILSFLPTKFAIRTSSLSRRFRRLWTASPSVHLDRANFSSYRHFMVAANRCFRLRIRDASAPLERFVLRSSPDGLPYESAIELLNRAHSPRLRHLSLDIHSKNAEFLVPHVLSFPSLQSLSIDACVVHCLIPPVVPPTFPATRLKSLRVTAPLLSSDYRRLINKQTQLEYLCLENPPWKIDLVSHTLKGMKLIGICLYSADQIKLVFPALEFLDFTIQRLYMVKQFHGEMPMLRKAHLKVLYLSDEIAPVFAEILRPMCNVSEFSIRVNNTFPDKEKHEHGFKRRNHVSYPEYHLFVEARDDLPTFPHLRTLKLSMCFHEDGISDLICLLQKTPVLESLELNHVEFHGGWESKLPQDSEGNNQHAHFSNLHSGDRKIELLRLLSSEGRHKKFKG